MTGVILSALLTLPLVPIPFSDEWLRRPLADDAYYYLVIARNIARGSGITTGGLPTSGFQPLYLIVCLVTGAIAGWDAIGVPMAVTAVNWLLYNAVGTWLIARLWRSMHPESRSGAIGLLAPFLWLANPLGQSIALNGMETTLALLAWIVTAMAICRYGLLPLGAKPSACIGSALGFAFLARNDAVVLVAGYAIASGLRLRQDPPAEINRSSLSLACRSMLVTLAAVLCCAAPWLLSNLLKSGTPIPQGGRAELAGGLYDFGRAYQLDRVIEAMVRNLYPVPLPFGSIPASLRIPAALVLFTAVFGIILVLLRCGAPAFRHVCVFLACSILLLALIYGLLFGAAHMARRWLAPAVVLSVLAGAEGAYVLHRLRPHLARPAMLALVAVAAVGRVGWAHVESSRASPTNTWGLLEYVRTHDVPAPIGAFQAGLLSWILPDVVNLDGKTNPEALDALEHGRFGAWLAASSVECVVDSNLLGTDDDPLIRSAFEVLRTPEGIVLLKRRHKPGNGP